MPPKKGNVIITSEPIDLFTAMKNMADAAQTAHRNQVSLHREKLLCIEAAASIALASSDPVMYRVALEEILKEAKG